MADFLEGSFRRSIESLFSGDAIIKFCHPFGNLKGTDDFFNNVYKPLISTMLDLECRDLIIVAWTTLES